MSFCKNCGNQLKEGERFCPSCGTGADAIANPQASISVSIDAKQFEDGILRIKDALISLFKNPFNGATEAKNILNPFSSYLFAVLLALAYGLSGLWTKSALLDSVKNLSGDSLIASSIGSLLNVAFKISNGKVFGLTLLTVLLCIAVVFGILYLVSNVILKQNQKSSTLFNAALFPFVLFLGINLLENLSMYISFKLYIVLLIAGIIFLIVYLYHNISLVITNNDEYSQAAYTSAVCFVGIVIVYNLTMLNNLAAVFSGNIQNMFKGLMF